MTQKVHSVYASCPQLDSAQREIRLSSLHESADANALLSGDLRLATLDDDYTALSYVWGDENNRTTIRINGFDTTITANLSVVLRRLRTEKKGVNIWIDAICINQTDSTEKNHQVQMMSEIYRHANIQTIIWLGESDNLTDEAMTFVSTADRHFFEQHDPENPSTVWPALKHLLKRDWWSRIWVIQETMLSPNPVVKCGQQEVPFENFVVLRNLHWDFQMAELDRFRSLRNVWTDCPFAPLMWPNWKDWVGETLQSWLMDMASFQCSRPRDKVYALLGLTSRQSRGQITVEYDEGVMSDRAVFLEATRVCFREVGLLPLQQGQIDKVNSLQLPSWCPDWSSRAVCVPFVGFGFSPFPTTTSFHPPDDSWSIWKDKPNKPVFEFSEDGETLLTHGFIVDIVDYVDGVGTLETPEVPVYTGTDDQGRENARKKRLETTKKACLRWEKHLHSAQETGSANFANDFQEAFCRTLIANTNFNKDKVEWNTKHIFDTWVRRELSPDRQLASESARQEDVQDYSNSVVSRCAKRTFITTLNGRFGLAPHKTERGDLVCIFYGGNIPYILRNQPSSLPETVRSFIGEAYIHGIMQGEYLRTAKSDEFTSFRLI